MKPTFILFVLLLASSGAGKAARQKTVELTKDNPSTLIATDSKDYTIYGLRLGLTRQEAEKILAASDVLKGVQDDFNPSRIYVYYRDESKAEKDSVLYLIWKPGQARLSEITVFTGFKDSLTDNFKRLLTSEAADQSSDFVKSFVGLPDRSKVTLDVRSIGLKNTTYYYERLGLEVTNVHDSEGDQVVFALVAKTPQVKRARRR
jgi:hypothetical protein